MPRKPTATTERPGLALRVSLTQQEADLFSSVCGRLERTPTQQLRFLLRQYLEEQGAAAQPQGQEVAL